VLLLTFPLKCLQIKFRILCARKIDFDSWMYKISLDLSYFLTY
jgi:hypothetical protein